MWSYSDNSFTLCIFQIFSTSGSRNSTYSLRRHYAALAMRMAQCTISSWSYHAHRNNTMSVRLMSPKCFRLCKSIWILQSTSLQQRSSVSGWFRKTADTWLIGFIFLGVGRYGTRLEKMVEFALSPLRSRNLKSACTGGWSFHSLVVCGDYSGIILKSYIFKLWEGRITSTGEVKCVTSLILASSEKLRPAAHIHSGSLVWTVNAFVWNIGYLREGNRLAPRPWYLAKSCVTRLGRNREGKSYIRWG